MTPNCHSCDRKRRIARAAAVREAALAALPGVIAAAGSRGLDADLAIEASFEYAEAFVREAARREALR